MLKSKETFKSDQKKQLLHTIIAVLLFIFMVKLSTVIVKKYYYNEIDSNNTKNENQEEINLPRVVVVSGKIISISGDVIEMEARIKSEENRTIKIKLSERGKENIKKYVGEYDSEDNLVISNEAKIEYEQIEVGDNVSIIISKGGIPTDELGGVIEAEKLFVDIPHSEGLE